MGFAIFASTVAGVMLGWLFAWMIMFTEVTKACPEAVNTQCEYFGHQKICVVGEK